MGAAAIYVLDRTGYAIAASNWREPASFEGVDYQFRPYFRGAVAHGSAEHFALGTISHEAGLYLSRRVDAPDGGMLGVVVLKVDFRELEADWRQSNAPIFVTDEHGVVLLGSLPQWRFDVLAPLSEELAQRLRTSLQFGDARFQSVPISPPLQTSSAGTLVRPDVALPQIPAGSPLLHAAHHRIAGMDAAPAVAGAVRAEPRQRQCPAGRAAGAKPAGRHRRRAALPPAPRP